MVSARLSSQVATHHLVAAHGVAHQVAVVAAEPKPTAHAVAAEFEPAAGEGPSISRVAAVKGVAHKGLFVAYRVLTTKATSVIAKPAIVSTKATNVASKPASVASKPTSGVSCCQCRWIQCQAQCKRHRRRGIT
jgi:hypothetical protein